MPALGGGCFGRSSLATRVEASSRVFLPSPLPEPVAFGCSRAPMLPRAWLWLHASLGGQQLERSRVGAGEEAEGLLPSPLQRSGPTKPRQLFFQGFAQIKRRKKSQGAEGQGRAVRGAPHCLLWSSAWGTDGGSAMGRVRRRSAACSWDGGGGRQHRKLLHLFWPFLLMFLSFFVTKISAGAGRCPR